MWSIRVLKDGAVPQGHAASCIYPIVHLASGMLWGNAAINKSSSGFGSRESHCHNADSSCMFPSKSCLVFGFVWGLKKVVLVLLWDTYHACLWDYILYPYWCEFLPPISCLRQSDSPLYAPWWSHGCMTSCVSLYTRHLHNDVIKQEKH